jgi:hypothetical protein
MVIIENLKFCHACLHAAVNDEYTGLDYYLDEPEATQRMSQIKEGLAKLPGYPVYTGNDDEFSLRPCDCCGEKLAGERFEFNLLIDED